MNRIQKTKVANGIYWVEVPESELYVLCGCPSDTVKHLKRKGLINTVEKDNVIYETGPNCILLCDTALQNGEFTNLTEFPVLQMLYRQGMIVPNHPGNTGVQPILMGSKNQLSSQVNYIHRGNYGLLTIDELIAGGMKPKEAEEYMQMKLKFAFGHIRKPDELIETLVLGHEKTEIKNGVYIKRQRSNIYTFEIGDEKIDVDLNLSPEEQYQPPYALNYHEINRGYFSIINSGEGDGWDPDRPCMASVLIFQGEVFLIDAGPNLESIMDALGIGVNEVAGIFHTHAHDDHFAGLTTLMRSSRKINYYSTPLIRMSVIKKLCALLDLKEDDFEKYFNPRDLEFDQWNSVSGLEVKPIISPHPVETNIFYFRAQGSQKEVTYGHLADVASFEVLDSFVSDDENRDGISEKFVKKTKKSYLTRSNLKKIDIGGGLIHGQADDFAKDKSENIILCHIDRELNIEEKAIGSSAPFGTTFELLPSYQDYDRRMAFEHTKKHIPFIPEYHLRVILNNPLVKFNPGTIILKSEELIDSIYLILSGTVEYVNKVDNILGKMSAGTFLGELNGIQNNKMQRTYRAKSFVKALEIPLKLYMDILGQYNITELVETGERRRFLRRISLFRDNVTNELLDKLCQFTASVDLKDGEAINDTEIDVLYFINEGHIGRYYGEEILEKLNKYDFFGEAAAVFGAPLNTRFVSIGPSRLFKMLPETLNEIPIVQWKLLEAYRARESRFQISSK